MDRRNVILKYVTKEQRGIEIGPFHSPIAPKRDGYNCLVMDVFDTGTTRAMAAENPSISDEQASQIEDIDLVGSCTHIDDVVSTHGLLGQFDYIVSSHNFEHLPNPVRFLQGCAKVLKPGGIISMAIPDRRSCYDYFRPVTRLSDWLDAWLDDRSKPTLAQAFDDRWVRASYDHHGVPHGSFFRGAPPRQVSAAMTFAQDFAQWQTWRADGDAQYHDAHCSVFTPASFELLLRDSAYLGLIPFDVLDISDSPGVDFFVHLRLAPATQPSNYEEIRSTLLHRVLDEASETATSTFDNIHVLENETARHTAETDAHQRDAAAANQRIAELTKEVMRLTAPRQRELVSVSQQITELTNETARLAAADDLRQREMAAANQRISELTEALKQVHTSTSWRMTEPIRRAIIAWRGLRLRH